MNGRFHPGFSLLLVSLLDCQDLAAFSTFTYRFSGQLAHNFIELRGEPNPIRFLEFGSGV